MHKLSYEEDQSQGRFYASSNGSPWHKWLGCTVGTGAYRIVRHLGSGGMGHVFMAESAAAQVAVKLISEASGSEHQRRFADETEMLLGQTHPNIVRAIEAGTMADRTPYLMMEYLPGPTLAQWLVYSELRPPSRILYLVAQVASALQHLHTQGVLHRDIKPANLMLDEHDDGLKLIDFGIAVREGSQRCGDNQHLAGTPAYMAPELLAGEPCTRLSDSYALGALALELLTRELPHGDAPIVSILDALLHRCPVSPSARGTALRGLNDFFERALSRDAAERFHTPRELVGALAEALHPLRSAPPEVVPCRPVRTTAVVMRDEMAGGCQ